MMFMRFLSHFVAAVLLTSAFIAVAAGILWVGLLVAINLGLVFFLAYIVLIIASLLTLGMAFTE